MGCDVKGERIRSKKAGIKGRGLGYGDGAGPMLKRVKYDIELNLDAEEGL